MDVPYRFCPAALREAKEEAGVIEPDSSHSRGSDLIRKTHAWTSFARLLYFCTPAGCDRRKFTRPSSEIRNMTKPSLLVLAAVSAVATTGCFSFEHKSNITGPAATGTKAFVGTWTSGNIIPSPTACSNFKWSVSEQTATKAKGSFSATCAGDLRLSGIAEGELTSPTTLKWKADGNATAPGLTSCAINLTGTAELQSDSIRVPYSGKTCLGDVQGIESLRKR